MKGKLTQDIIGAVVLILVTTAAAYSQGKIAFDSCGDGNCEIYLINPDGTGERRLTFNSAMDRQPSLAANGTKIAFSTNRDGNFEIYTMNLDGSNPTRLTNNNHNESEPVFSPDGSRIAYAWRDNGAGFPKIAVMNADGSNQTVLPVPGDNYDPSFTSDGRRIIYASGQHGSTEIYIMNLDGTGQTRPS